MSNSHSILLTRELSGEQLQLAESLGLNVFQVPALSIEYRNDWLTVHRTLDETKKFALTFTSQNGVKGFYQFIQAGISIPKNVPVYAVGGKTARALEEIGFDNITEPEQQNGVGLAHMIIDDFLKSPELKSTTILHFCGDKRRDELRHYLTESEIEIKDIVVYKTKLNHMNLPQTDLDGILFYSPSSVQAFRKSGGFRYPELPELFAIGPTTAEELSIESGKHVHISPKPDTEVFLKFVARVLGENRPLNGKKNDHSKRKRAERERDDV